MTATITLRHAFLISLVILLKSHSSTQYVQSLLLTPSGAPILSGSTKCHTNQFLCGGKCVDEDAQCKTKACRGDTPFYLLNGTCSESILTNTFTQMEWCASPNYLCWNGECKQSPSDCITIPACLPSYPKRCQFGCVKKDQECPDLIECPSEYRSCLDGSCVLHNQQCPPFDGCPLEFPIMCGNRACVQEPQQCSNCSNCNIVPPWAKKPVELQYEFKLNETTQFNIFSEDALLNNNTAIMSIVTIPPNTFRQKWKDNNNNTDTNRMVLFVSAVADSSLMQTTYMNNNQSLELLMSPVVNLTVNEDVEQPFDHSVEVTFILKNPLGSTQLDDILKTSSICIAYIDESTNQWKCVDDSPSFVAHSDGTIVLTGYTNHFTAFSVLVAGRLEDDRDGLHEKKKDSGVPLPVLIGAISAAIIFAVVLLTVGLIADRRRRKKRDSRRKTLSDMISKAMNSTNSFPAVPTAPNQKTETV